MKASSHRKLSGIYDVESADRSFMQVIARRAAPVRPLPAVSNTDAEWMKLRAYANAGLEAYNDCWTGEMANRPIPFISTDDRPKQAQSFVDLYLPSLLRYLGPSMKPGYQPINKVSRLGYPVNANPGNGLDAKTRLKVRPSKFDVTMAVFEQVYHDDWSLFKDAFLTHGRRLQNELPDTKRVQQFINAQGDIYERTTSRDDRLITVPDLGVRVGSRTRIITQPPVYNLYLQCFDSVLHSAIMSHPLCDSNMYKHRTWAPDQFWITFDCKHYERYLGMAAISYANIVGGVYGEKLLEMIHMKSLVPSDDWKACKFIKPRFAPGTYPQFNSGICAVATIGKIANICAQIHFFVTHKGMSVNDAIQTVLSGTSPGLQRWMYGDDNRVTGDPVQCEEYVNYMASVFEIERDDEPKYLGMVLDRDKLEFLLPASTYNLKLYQPERDFSWRTYPYLGLVERRRIFSEFGAPVISRDIIPFEDELWTAIGDPFHRIISNAAKEAILANQSGVQLNRWMVTDKEYLMTAQEEMSTGLFWHVPPTVVASIINKIVGPTVRESLNFKSIENVPIPVTNASKHANIYDTYHSTEEEEAADNLS
jgi:hypothetical protein